MTRSEYADFLLPNVNHSKEAYENIFKERESKGNFVTRIAPSPTGFVHVGTLYTGFVASKFARQNNGTYILRIEDTDQKRLVEGGVSEIVKVLDDYGIKFDEGMKDETTSYGEYGPYIQSQRKDIYQAFAKYLIERDLAYPCFMSEEELNEIRSNQEARKQRIGIYGRYARFRNISIEDAIERINNGEKYIIRLKSPGNFDNKVYVDDAIKGNLEFPENDLDIVIIKHDGLPTYHFAHLVDDHLMHVTHVIRADEWVSSLPIHAQLFDIFEYERPIYAHLSPLMKKDGDITRKLSKRKDPEAAVSHYHETGIPKEALMIYIMTVANSNFEAWFDKCTDGNFMDFELTFDKVSTSGALFDLDKIINISKNYLSKISAKELYERTLEYTNEYDREFYDLLKKYENYSINVLNIERECERPRKDIDSYSSVRKEISYMYDELFNPNYSIKEYYDINFLEDYFENYYSISDDKNTWFDKIKECASKYNYCANNKEYKANPESYKGNISHACEVIRVCATGKEQTPDLYEILKLLGKDRIKIRFEQFKKCF